jgi:MFS family permease
VRSARHRRFVRVVAVAAPWVFGGAALGYGYLPTQLRGVTGSWGLVFATATTVVALGVSSVIQPAAKRLHSAASARGLAAGLLVLAAGIAACVLAITAQSVWWGLAANVVIGAGLGITMVSGLLEVQAIAAPGDLAGLTGAFYALAYAGFLAPAVISALAGAIPVTAILWVIVGLAVACWALVLSASTRHLPTAENALSHYSRGRCTVVPDVLLPGPEETAWRTRRVPPRGRCWRWRPSRTTLASPPSASVTGSVSPNGPPAGMSRSCGRPSCRSSRSAARSAATGWAAACGCRR